METGRFAGSFARAADAELAALFFLHCAARTAEMEACEVYRRWEWDTQTHRHTHTRAHAQSKPNVQALST